MKSRNSHKFTSSLKFSEDIYFFKTHYSILLSGIPREIEEVKTFISHSLNSLIFFRKLGTKWMLYLTDNDNNEYLFYHSDVFSFQMSACVRWFTLEFPSIKSLKKLKVYAVNPVFFDQKLQPVPNR